MYATPSSAASTPVRVRNTKAASMSSNSFDAVNTSNSYSNKNQSCTKSNGNNTLLWLMFIIHLATSIPQELYRYFQLNIDFQDENVLDEYITSILLHPIVKARPYYALQLLYITEFVMMPILFIIFYLCSNVAPARSDSDDVNIIKEGSGVFRGFHKYFYDSELCKSKHGRNFLKMHKKAKKVSRPSFIHNVQNNDALLMTSATRENSVKIVKHEGKPLAKHHKHAKRSGSSATQSSSTSSQLQPTPFEIATHMNMHEQQQHPHQQPEASYFSSNTHNSNNNLVHIIQHPSWRINIKQNQPNVSSRPANFSTNSTTNNGNYDYYNDEMVGNGGIQLPVNYIKTNNYKS